MDNIVAIMIVVVIVAAGLAIVGTVVGRRKRQERQQEFEQLAAGRGWQFLPDDNSYAKRWTGTPFTRRGRARNVLIGQHRGRNFCSFEYSYTTTTSTGQSTSTQTHYFAVYVVSLPAAVPTFSVGAEGILGGKVAEAFGFERVEIGDQDFNNTFKVKCDDAAFGTLVLQPDLIDLLKSTGAWDWRFSGQDMISYERGNFEPAGLQPRLDLMCDVLDRVPKDAWQRPGQQLPSS